MPTATTQQQHPAVQTCFLYCPPSSLQAFHGLPVLSHPGSFDVQDWLAPGDLVHHEAAAFDFGQLMEDSGLASTGQYDILNDMNMDFASLTHFNSQHLDASSDPSPALPTSQHTDLLDFPPPSTGASPQSTSSTPSNTSNSKSASGGSCRPRDEDDAAAKRYRNTLAARKYRQKRLDRIKELEEALEAVSRERDELRIKLARQEAQTEALKSMMKFKEDKS
ncbi:hypothetical protein jhhlp_008340 [Lomentospora prolificans]|uniref:BZIP domain-containing protein n=1 Tax=Lomentospora prolificans TaxID=41688 RepID=A0A2N3MXS7_9PEZI|nr:hypothetical protein jhhlp_008340 [Lomentospora prolificans]